MLKHLPAINKTMKGVGTLMDNERPVVRFMAQHWPLTAITGYALYRRLNKRRKDKSLSTFTALTDTGMVLGPLAVVAIFSLAANKKAPAPVQNSSQRALPAPAPQVNGFAGDVPPPEFFATRPPHEVNAHVPAAAEEVITAPGAPPSPADGAGSSGMFDSFLS